MCDNIEVYVKDLYDVLHAIPEKGMEEYKTSEFVAKTLRELKIYNVIDHVGSKTGVLGILDTGINGPTLGLRADMDALEYVVDGQRVMRHTCGHDAHTAMLLAAAKTITLENNIKKGKLFLIFQPSEERLNGALSMLNSGLLNGITHLVGMHVRPVDDMPIGKATPDMWHSASSILTCTINGIQAHGARPHLGVNAIDVAVAVVNAINAIKEKPDVAHSIKVTNMSVGSDAYNVIPDEVFMAIDIRSQTNPIMSEMLEKVKNILEYITQAYGAKYSINSINGVPAAEFDQEMITVAEKAITSVLGPDASVGTLYNPGGEDFHYMTQKLKCKSTYIGLGADASPGLHHKDMSLNKDALIKGVKIWREIITQILGE